MASELSTATASAVEPENYVCAYAMLGPSRSAETEVSLTRERRDYMQAMTDKVTDLKHAPDSELYGLLRHQLVNKRHEEFADYVLDMIAVCNQKKPMLSIDIISTLDKDMHRSNIWWAYSTINRAEEQIRGLTQKPPGERVPITPRGYFDRAAASTPSVAAAASSSEPAAKKVKSDTLTSGPRGVVPLKVDAIKRFLVDRLDVWLARGQGSSDAGDQLETMIVKNAMVPEYCARFVPLLTSRISDFTSRLRCLRPGSALDDEADYRDKTGKMLEWQNAMARQAMKLLCADSNDDDA